MKDMTENLLQIIKSNIKYTGNEDLVEDFLSEATKRTLSISVQIENVDLISPYLKKVVNTSILHVLKTSGRIRRERKKYVSNDIYSLDMKLENDAQTTLLDTLEDPAGDFTAKVDNKIFLQSVCDRIIIADSENPDKNYHAIFNKRYTEGKTQSQIASELNISQGEVCKRLYELSKIIKENVDGY